MTTLMMTSHGSVGGVGGGGFGVGGGGWKKKTFNQITSYIQMNKNTVKLTKQNMRNPMPLKIYRKEIASVQITHPKNQRIGVSIDEYNRPNGHTRTTITPSNQHGICFTLDAKDANDVNNRTYHPGSCQWFSPTTDNAVCLTPDQNAKNRVRTSGVLKRKYYTTTKEYLASRNETFEKNQFNYLKTGVNGTPGTHNTLQNMYAPQQYYVSPDDNCVNSVVHYKPNNPQFAQQGAVSSSTLTSRIVYDTVSSNTMKFRTSYGNAVANAMAYNVFDKVYTIKDKIGYPMPKTPIFNKYTNTMSCKTSYLSKR